MMHKEIKGLKIPVIGLGTYQVRDTSIISAALSAGYRHIDTARSYHNEHNIGEAIRLSGIDRKELFITTKIWHDRLKPEQIRADVEDSLKKLQTDYVDLLLIHWPSSENVPLKDTVEEFLKLKDEGKTRAIGASNFTPQLLNEADAPNHFHCVQVEYHPFLKQQELMHYCEKNNLALTAYRPIAKNSVSNSEIIKEIASKYQKTPVQVTLRWLIQQEMVLAIPRSSKIEHLKSNLEVFDFELTDEEMQDIHRLDKGERQVNPAFAPDW